MTLPFRRLMQSRRGTSRVFAILLLAGLTLASTRVVSNTILPNLLPVFDDSGVFSTYSKNGGIDVSNAFFKSLGTNGRSCVTCHQPGDGWSITPKNVKLRFLLSAGTDPIFRTVDGSNCPSADVSNIRARQKAYSMLMNKGVIRVSLPVPQNADFTVTQVEDPHSGAHGNPCPETTSTQLAMFRRPLPASNLPFLSTVMWDGRESGPAAPTPAPATILAALGIQAIDATLGHAQASHAPRAADVEAIVQFEMALSTAQTIDKNAGDLTANGAKGGPKYLSEEKFFLGINDPLGGNPTGFAFNPSAFTLYTAWLNLPNTSERNRARASIARGEAIFNTRPIRIRGVRGLNDKLGVDSIDGTCTTCHDSPNAGDHSLALPINIGISDYPAVSSALDISGLPVYSITCNDGTQVRTTDPGRALISGRCADIGKVKGPVLRGLASRAPYFHNGSAATLLDAVDFYNDRFDLGLTDREKADLVAFLKTL